MTPPLLLLLLPGKMMLARARGAGLGLRVKQ
jgi:hypothetical protein